MCDEIRKIATTIIPFNMEKEFKNYLIKLEKELQQEKTSQEMTADIEYLLGSSIFNDNQVMTSLINIFIRDNDIKINKKRILNNIYGYSCYRDSANNPGTMSQYQSFESVYPDYRRRYTDLFVTKS